MSRKNGGAKQHECFLSFIVRYRLRSHQASPSFATDRQTAIDSQGVLKLVDLKSLYSYPVCRPTICSQPLGRQRAENSLRAALPRLMRQGRPLHTLKAWKAIQE